MTARRAGLVVALVGALVTAWSAARVGRPTAREDVALLLFGLPDPDRLQAKGLHGFGVRSVALSITEPERCRFRLATADGYEEIDFNRVSAIRHVVVLDPEAGLVHALGGASGHTGLSVPKLALARVIGTEEALCNGHGCVATRAFALSDPERLEQSREAAADFRARFCPGLAPRG